MARHNRDWWLHESEHVLVVLLVAVVLLQAVQIDRVEESGDPVVIVPATESFTARPGQTVLLPWLVVNTVDTSVDVRSGVMFDWERSLDDREQGNLPDGITALVAGLQYTETSSLDPGDHRTYRYRFRAPTTPGQYQVTVVAEVGDHRVTKPVVMDVQR